MYGNRGFNNIHKCKDQQIKQEATKLGILRLYIYYIIYSKTPLVNFDWMDKTSSVHSFKTIYPIYGTNLGLL